ncbi:MAG: hypothetical protein COA82_12770 [Alkaliphilus sp.]|nr:MAG: hypothetical protein COA82_12770 [Alkaliphilus sp.]
MKYEETRIQNNQETAKTLFFPHFFYLCYDSFRQIIDSLNCLGMEGYMVHMHCKSFDESKQFPTERLKKDKCPFKQLPFFSIGQKGTGLFVKSMRFFEFLINYYRIKRYLQDERPDSVVVASDLGGMYIRFILDTCERMHIPVLIIVPVDFGSVRSGDNANTETRVPKLAQFILHFLGMERLILFEGRVIGSYSKSGKVLVASKAMQNQLVKDGICRERVLVTGIPRHDRLYELLKEPIGAIKSEICCELGLDTSCKIVVYFTQLVQHLYGADYMDSINKLLVNAFQDLPAECRIVVKLHPREDATYFKIFDSDRYQVVRDIDVDRLLRAADLVISHFSSTLSDAALLGTPLLNINILNDQHRSIFASSQDLLQIKSETEFAKIHDILYDIKFRDRAKALLKSWAKDNVAVVDGRSSERIARIIKQSIIHKDG